MCCQTGVLGAVQTSNQTGLASSTPHLLNLGPPEDPLEKKQLELSSIELYLDCNERPVRVIFPIMQTWKVRLREVT